MGLIDIVKKGYKCERRNHKWIPKGGIVLVFVRIATMYGGINLKGLKESD